MNVPEIPRLDEMLRSLRNIPDIVSKTGLSGAIDGGRTANQFYEHLIDNHSDFAAGSIIDSVDIAGLFSCVPVGTAIVQTLKQGTLLYGGHIDAGTALARVACSMVCVGTGAGVGTLIGTMIFPVIGTLAGGILGGLFGGRASKAIIESDFADKRQQYIRAREDWEQQIERARCGRNGELREFCEGAVRRGVSNPQTGAFTPDVTKEYQRHLVAHAELITEMVNELNRLYGVVKDALKKLRG